MTGQLGFLFDDTVVPASIVESGPIEIAGPAMAAASPLQDGIAEYSIGCSRNMLVAWFLVASWSYYVGDHPLISDALFDRICRDLDAEWEAIEHRHKHLIDRAWLTAGTCALAREAYPPSVRGAAAHLARTGAGVEIPRA